MSGDKKKRQERMVVASKVQSGTTLKLQKVGDRKVDKVEKIGPNQVQISFQKSGAERKALTLKVSGRKKLERV